jgi:hypothetical protein
MKPSSGVSMHATNAAGRRRTADALAGYRAILLPRRTGAKTGHLCKERVPHKTPVWKVTVRLSGTPAAK